MKSKLNKPISYVLVLTLIFVLSSNLFYYKAAAETVTENSLSEQIEKYDGTYWEGPYHNAYSCKGFAAMIFNELFGNVFIGSTNSTKPSYYIPSPSGAVEIARYDTAADNVQLRTLFSKARPGDFIQWARYNSSGALSQHSAIFVSCDDSGVLVFDCNWIAQNKCGTHIITYEKFLNNLGISLYTATNYNDIDLSIPMGDVDNDMLLSSSDALLVLNHSTGESLLSSKQLQYADVDGNGIINSYDALEILKIATK